MIPKMRTMVLADATQRLVTAFRAYGSPLPRLYTAADRSYLQSAMNPRSEHHHPIAQWIVAQMDRTGGRGAQGMSETERTGGSPQFRGRFAADPKPRVGYRLRQGVWLLKGLVRAPFVGWRRPGPEIHVFVVWSHALEALPEILADIEHRFLIRDVFRIDWGKDNFSRSMARFYGGVLPPNAKEEEHCGTDPFMLVVVEDERPHYGPRPAPKGVVNVAMFDAERRYRGWTGGGHRVHATVNPAEAEHDLFLLLGRRAADYLAVADRWDGQVREHGALIGADSWSDVDELLTALEVSISLDVVPRASGPATALRLVVDDRVRAALTANARPRSGELDSELHDVMIDQKPTALELLQPTHASLPNPTARLREGAEGSLRRVQSARGRGIPSPSAVILLYHRIAEPGVDPFRLCVPPERFKQHLELLSAAWPIVPLEELVSDLDTAAPARPGVVVTFDDGYVDNLEVAYPIASSSNVPMTVFVTGRLNGEPFWWDELAALICDNRHLLGDALKLRLRGRRRSFPMATEKQRRVACLEIHRELKLASENERRRVLDRIAGVSALPIAASAGRPMRTDELERLAGLPTVTIGSHGINLRALSSLTAEERLAELEQAKQFAEEASGQSVAFFSYPFGRPRDVGKASARAVAEAGYRAACTTVQSAVTAGADVYELPRLTVHDEPGEDLLGRVTQLLKR
jgi:peptidoglycan/xylan/chitin deacetylase (PgdA/CDA1 family)